MKKIIIIIEDSPQAFIRIKNIINVKTDIECKQNYTFHDYDTDIKESFINNLRNSLEVMLLTEEEQKERNDATARLINELQGYCEENENPIYLIDYFLAGNNKKSDINGIDFHQKILPKIHNKPVPTLFITNANGTSKLDVEEYVENINNKSICDFQTKPDPNDWNRIKKPINDFINKAYSSSDFSTKTFSTTTNEYDKD